MNQNPNPSGSSLQAMFNDTIAKIDRYIVRAQRFLQEFMARAGRPVDTLYAVALERVAEGEFEDAASRLKMVVKFRPALGEAWYYLGTCQLELGEEAEAASAFKRTVALLPNHEEARFLLAVISPDAFPPDKQPKYAPLTLAINHFDTLAATYDREHLDMLGYAGHEELFKTVRQYLNPNYKNFQIIDLGCGTGLVGLLFRDIAGRIEGVDISPFMLEQAELRRDVKERKIYDKLQQEDLRQFLIEQPENSADLLLSANVFPYLGGLTPVFDGAAKVLKPGGVFAFTIDEIEGGDFALIPHEGRFGHSKTYIEAQAQRIGFEMVDAHPFDLYDGVEAMAFVLRKPAPAQPQPQQPAPQNPA